MRFVKPLDTALVNKLASQYSLLVTLEENTIQGGAGTAVSEHLASMGIVVAILHLGLPDKFVDHGNHQQQLAATGLDPASIKYAIEQRISEIECLHGAVS